MKKLPAFSFLAMSSLLLLGGCASSGREGGGVNAQMGVLADEVTRLDQALQETRAQLQQEQARIGDLESRAGITTQGASQPVRDGSTSAYATAATEPYVGVYRTPSGFELPSTSVQKALKAAGFYNGDVDGKIGPGTREAVRNFQRANGLTPDGIIGKTTWNKLKVHLEPQGG